MLPDIYKGKEQTFIKHRLLEAYLERLLMIIGRYEQRICFIDCFAGPWQAGGEDLHGTSIAISLEIMKKCRVALQQKYGRHVQFRALYIEKTKKAFDRLERFLANQVNGGVSMRCLKGEFYDLRSEILKWCGTADFCFFFIDPTGWRDIGVPTLSPLLKRGRSEFLINLMYNFLVRAHSQPVFESRMREIFGEVPDTTGMSPKSREKYLLRLYREHLKRETGERARTAYVRVLDPLKERPKYHLVYLTSHELGITVFMQGSEKLDIEQKQVRAQAKQNHRVDMTRQREMFPASQTPKHGDTGIEISEVKNYWLEGLGFSPKRFGIVELANMLEETDWFPGDFQRAFSQLEAEGMVRNLDAKGKRTRNPIRFDRGELLTKVKP